MKHKRLISISVLSLLLTLFLYSSLPDQIAVHFNLSGEADQFGSKIVTLILGVLPLLMIGLFQLLPKLDPKQKAYQKFEKPYQRMLVMITFLLISIHWMILLTALGYTIHIAILTQGLASLLIIVLGNHLGQVKPNYFVGIKTPWTLASDRVWTKTHRQGGKLFVLSGLLGMIGIFISSPFRLAFLLVPLVFTTLGLVIYSYHLFKKEQASHN